MQGTIVLEDLLESNPTTIATFKDALYTHGWCFLTIKPDHESVKGISYDYKRFFEDSTDVYKNFYKTNNILGYYRNGLKEGFRALTSEALLKKAPDMYHMAKLCKYANEISHKIVDVCGESVFGKSKAEMSEKIPLFCPPDSTLVAGCGLLDIVLYSNIIVEEGNPALVFEHGDPGLFSLSFVSSEPGLSMYDRVKKEWIPIPPDSTILWCGSAAAELSGGKVQVGWHKVDKNTNGKRRLAVWYEVCTFEQIPKSIQDGTEQNKPDEPENEEAVLIFVKTLTGKIIDITVSVHDHGSKLKEKIEEKTGIPGPKQRVIMYAKQLNDELSLKEQFSKYNIKIKSGDYAYLVLALRGGDEYQ